MPEEEGQTQVAPEERTQTTETPATEKDGGKAPQTVPYERLQEVAKQNQELKTQLAALQSQFEETQIPEKDRARSKERQELAKEFYRDPYGQFEKWQKEAIDNVKRIQSETSDYNQYRAMLDELRRSPGHSQEVEDAIAEKLREHGLSDVDTLNRIGRARALKIAFETATGKKWGQWGEKTTSVKTQLRRPSGGGGGAYMLSPEEFSKIPPDQYEKDPKKYDAALLAFTQQNA